MAKKHPEAMPHDPLVELFEDVYLAHGSVRIGPGIRMNRNMVVIRQDRELTLVNPVRLNRSGLDQLESLGSIQRVMRLGDFHGLDDPFYIDSYGAEFWCQEGQATYPQPRPSHPITGTTKPPLRNAEFFLFRGARFPEAALLLKGHRLLITTDSVQNHSDWSYTTAAARLALKFLGFKQDLLIGGPWLKRVTPPGQTMKADFEQLLQLDFDHLIAAHGQLLRGGAKTRLQAVVNEAFGS